MTTKISKYEFFERGFAQLAMDVGYLDPAHFMRFIRYKLFLDYKAQGHNKSTAVQFVADQTRCSFSTAWRAVDEFSQR